MKIGLAWMLGALTGVGGAATEPVLARWSGGGGDTLVEVRGFDAAGNVRLAPADGTPGEALLPVSEVGDLRFRFSDMYRKAQVRVSIGRPAEALFLLQQEIPALVPYAVLEKSNVPTAVQLYLRLLLQNESWPEAVAIGVELTGSAHRHPLTAEVLNLIQALIRAERMADAAWLVSRVPIDDAAAEDRAEVARVAQAMRRGGHWREARMVYARLASSAPDASASPWVGLVAYCSWHLGDLTPARELVAAWPERSAAEWAGLWGLLTGRIALADGQPAQALDTLGEALVRTSADSEWRHEITVVLVEGYRAHGQIELAERLQADLIRWYPDSLFLPALPPS